MPYTYDRTKTASYYDDPYGDEILPDWSTPDLEREVAAEVKKDLIEFGPKIKSLSDGKLGLKVKRVEATETDADLKDAYGNQWSWGVKLRVDIELEITGVAGKRMTPQEIFDLFERGYNETTELESSDGLYFEPVYTFTEKDIDVRFYGDLLKVKISAISEGGVTRKWQEEDPPMPDW